MQANEKQNLGHSYVALVCAYPKCLDHQNTNDDWTVLTMAHFSALNRLFWITPFDCIFASCSARLECIEKKSLKIGAAVHMERSNSIIRIAGDEWMSMSTSAT